MIVLKRVFASLAVAAALIVIAYYYVDRPVAYFVHQRDFAKNDFWKWLTYPPPLMQSWAPALIALLAARRAFGPLALWERTAFAASIGLIVADQFRESLSFVFGRYWPDTWIDDNPSLIRNGAYGFHPLHSGSAYGSFPSGHAARVFAAAAPLWIAYPVSRLPCAIACLAIAAGLIAMNYHFVSDVIAGAYVGGLVGVFGGWFCWTKSENPRDC